VDGGDGARHIGGVENQVSNLAEEDIGRTELQVAGISVLIPIKQTNNVGRKVLGGLDDGQVGSITDDLGIIVVDDGTGDEVYSRRELAAFSKRRTMFLTRRGCRP
jgi:hypothetical protein